MTDPCKVDIDMLEEFLQVHFDIALNVIDAMKRGDPKVIRSSMEDLNFELDVFKSAVRNYLVSQARLCLESRKTSGGKRKL